MGKQEGVEVVNKKSDQERIQSIKDHFDALTAMTPEEYNSVGTKDSENGHDDNANESEGSEEEGNVMPDAYNPDTGKVLNLRADFKEGKKEFKKKRKLELKNEKQTEKYDTDKSNVPQVKVENSEQSSNLNDDLSKRPRLENKSLV